MSDHLTDVKKRARLMLRLEQPNAAINILRVPESREDAELCALLAEAYFRRGDTKGDVHSSSFFASRAIALGKPSARLQAIRAIGAFRKEQYAEACDAFATFVDEDRSANTRYIYGLCCLRAGRLADAERWLSSALETSHLHPDYTAALAETRRTIAGGTPAAAPVETPPSHILGGIRERRPAEVPSPYRHSALSRLAGTARAAKDMHWLAVNIPCQEACPARTDIPRYLTEIHDGDYAAAYRTNLLDNVFPAVLGRVCARPCEKACRHGWENLGASVAICFSKRSAADFNPEADPVVLEPLFAPSGKRIAVVGGGVAGLTAARELARFGHTVTVYEKHSRPGGMMNQGIPVFRLPRAHIEREIEQIRRMGVTILSNTPIGKDSIPLEKLAETFDAVVLAAGTLRPNMLSIPGAGLEGIRHGLDFLLEVNETGSAPVGRDIVVIGGGFTAMDCARSARRLGVGPQAAPGTDWRSLPLEKSTAVVNVYYRRSVNEMLVTPGEIEELEHEGIGMFTLVSPVAYVGNAGRVRAIRFIRNRLGEPDSSGRRRPEPVAGSEFEVPADLVLLATGQFPDTGWMEGPLKDGLVAPDQWLRSGGGYRTAHPRIFAAGDFAGGASSLIDAIGHAKDCARTVDEALTGLRRLEDVARIEDDTTTRRNREMDAVPLQTMPALPPGTRTPEGEVETGYSQALAVDEAQRCYRCHYKYEIDADKCIYCDWCIKAKPRPNCIVKVRGLVYGDEGQITGFERALGSEDTTLIYINQEDCIRCNACVDACPVDCISIQKVSRTTQPCKAKPGTRP
jgi:NADPH-dependent glutamate synthase beta subunit-like oxidoreductase/ferredoxin